MIVISAHKYVRSVYIFDIPEQNNLSRHVQMNGEVSRAKPGYDEIHCNSGESEVIAALREPSVTQSESNSEGEKWIRQFVQAKCRISLIIS